MTASRLRRVGNLSVWVDPGDVVAVLVAVKPDRIDVQLASGMRLAVVDADPLGRPLTPDDLANLVGQLTSRTT